MMVGSAERSRGGVASVIRTMKAMPFWNNYNCFWLGTQIQGNKLQKLSYALKSYFVALFRIWKYDVIHFHTVPDFICLVIQLPVFLLAVGGRKKIIMQLHMGNQLEEHTHDRLFNWCMRRSDLIIVLADLWKNKFETEWFPNLKTPVRVLHNAIMHMEDIPYELHDNTILFAAYFDKNKGYNLLLDAYKKIYRKYPEWHLIMMGNGGVNDAKEYAKRLGLTEKDVSFPGYLTGNAKKDVFQKGGIFCLCSYQEGFPIVVLESWQYGIPLVTTPVGGLPDVIVNGKNAITFPFGDIDCLAKQIQLLIEDKNKRKEMSDFSKVFVEKNFSTTLINSKLEEIYKNLIS